MSPTTRINRLWVCLVLLTLAACPPNPSSDAGGGGGGLGGGAGGGAATDGGDELADSGSSGGGGSDAGRPDASVDAGPDPLFNVTQTVGPIDPPDGGMELEVVREFECDEQRVGEEAWLQDLEGAPTEALVIRPAGTPCSFQLLHRSGAASSPISTQPTGYLLTEARRFADGVRVVCASEVESSPVGASSVARRVDDVSIRCWASATTSFAVSTLAVQGGADWAPWVRTLTPSGLQSGAYILTWARDFSFQFFSMGERGRPPTDGLYETVLTWTGTTLTAGAPVQVSARSNPLAEVALDTWHPTRQEVDTLSPYMEFDPELDAGP